MLNIPQIEALRRSNPQLYEALRRLSEASLGPNQGWSIDDQITDGTEFARVTAGALTSGKIDPTKEGVLMKGSVPPTWSGAFTYVSTTSSITWSWSGLTICRADGTTTAIPSGSLGITGLAAGTTYYFYPYWDDTSAELAWVAGGSGSPANALPAKTNVAAQQQALQGRIPLSQGAMIAATTTSGTGGGSGGGSGSCLRSGTMVLTRERGTVPIESCKVGEHLRCPNPAGGEAWTSIARVEIRDADTFIRLHFSNAESLDVTPHHIFTLADGSPMRAERLCLSDILVGRFGRITLKRIETVVEDSQKVTVSCTPVLEFFAGRFAATVLTHNYTFSS
ncbi:MAG TPA: Hint domain-containing protein [Candidatus Acidoferrum sp.]|nr:Hint domain-containing protein [Candidatus Acidoferrum sp.]